MTLRYSTRESRLPDYDTSAAELNVLNSEELTDLQDERLKAMIRYVYANSSFWKGKLDAAHVDPDTFGGLKELHELPFCSKGELQKDQKANGPFGSYTCSPPEKWTRFFSTSGTTGEPLFRVFSDRDWHLILGRFLRLQMWKTSDIILLTAPSDGLIGPTAALESARAAGALVIPAGSWRTSRKISSMKRLRPNVINGTTSYLVHLLEAARAEGVDPREIGVERLSCVGEPGAAVEQTKALLLEGYGAQGISDGYGITELFPLGGNCPKSTEIHLSEDMVIVECLEPGTNTPVADGQPGELVYTNLVGDTQPVIRYRSGDLGVITDRHPCECGHTHRRIKKILGRVDEMIWYRGVNFFPSAVEDIVRSTEGLSPEYQIHIGQQGALPTVKILVEGEDHENDLESLVSGRIKDGIGISAKVEILPLGTLPRSTDGGKIRRVVDNRTN